MHFPYALNKDDRFESKNLIHVCLFIEHNKIKSMDQWWFILRKDNKFSFVNQSSYTSDFKDISMFNYESLKNN